MQHSRSSAVRRLAACAVAAVGLIAVDAGGARGSTPQADAAGDPVMGGTLIMAGDAEVTNPWTPAAMQCDSYCQQRARTFYDPIAAVGEDLQVHPFLAESITPNGDFTQWTIKMRSGITFHDGTPLNADAVIRNLRASAGGFVLRGELIDLAKEPAPTDADPNATQLKIDKVDDMTLTMYTGKNGDPNQPIPWPGFPFHLTGQFGMIASPAYLDTVAFGGDATKAVGTGPFILQSYEPRGKLVVTKNPNYWLKDAKGNRLPYLDSIEFRVIEDSETSGKALQSGDIQVFSTSASLVVANFRDMADEFPMAEQSQRTETNYGLMNLNVPVLQDKRVRCALSMAIDREEYVDTLDYGITTIANGLFSPGQEGYLDDNGFSTERNVEEAKRLIDEYETETGTQVTVNWGTVNSQANAQRADLIIGWWADIGVDATWQQVPQDAFITTALFGKPEDFQVFGWRNHGGVTVDQQAFWWDSRSTSPDSPLSLNFGRINDPIIDENLAKARSATDPAERQAAAEAINRRMAEECYQIPFSYTTWGAPHVASLHGFGTMPMPDGSGPAPDGVGQQFAGAFWTQNLWLDTDG